MNISLGDCVGGFDSDTGDPCVDTTTFAPSSLCVTSDCLMSGTQLTPAQLAAAGITSGGGGNTSQAITPTSGNAISNLLASLTSAASGAVKAATTPAPYYVTGPNGQSVLYNPATGSVLGTSGTALTGTTGSSGILLLMLAGLAIFAMEKR